MATDLRRDTAALIRGVPAGDRRALARAITLVESTRGDDREAAGRLMDALMPATGGAVRLGITGAPGAGKSTFIEALGLHLLDLGRRVAVLAVDPSSGLSGGSILGDKTRMERLAASEGAFIRPSPARGLLGGVARRTREAMLLCEAAGHDVVIVETVGVGQSETEVAGMVDVFLLLLAPAAGDALQGIKRGIVELAHILVITKADGSLAGEARHAAVEYGHALSLIRGAARGRVPVLQCSALEGRGVAEVWSAVLAHEEEARASGAFGRRRAVQARMWMWQEIEDTLGERLRAHAGVRAILGPLEAEVEAGRIDPAEAARRVLAAFLSG
jgi:LAO/AO transport system kinase